VSGGRQVVFGLGAAALTFGVGRLIGAAGDVGVARDAVSLSIAWRATVWKNIAVRASALAGLLFGALSVVVGTRVLTGIDRPDYVVLPWLVRYNVAAGIVGVVVGVGLWTLRMWFEVGQIERFSPACSAGL